MKKIIAIDGPAASGKGTLAKNLAEHLNFAHMDTGALYRAVGYAVLKAGGNPDNKTDALKGCVALVGDLGILSSRALRNEECAAAASKVAAMKDVRDALLDMQREFAQNPGEGFNGAVLDGRDVGTVICPKAPLKLYITACDEIRAERRMKELQLKGKAVTKGDVLEDMRARDARDKARVTAPLKVAGDAIVIDTSNMNAAQVLEKALEYVKKTFPSL